MQFFRPKPPIGRDEFDWLVACFAWLRAVLKDEHIRPDFVLPNNPKLAAATTAQQLFEAVRSLAGMENWDCRLENVAKREEDLALGLIEGTGACGTFSLENGQAIVRYSSDMLKHPEALAATFAHELCHYLLADAGDPPGGPDLMEHSTDCAAVYLGFGVLLANSARQFEQQQIVGGSQWRSWTAGYLSEASLVTATAMFANLHQYDLQDAYNALKPHLQKDLRKAAKAVTAEHHDFASHLNEVDLLDWNFD